MKNGINKSDRVKNILLTPIVASKDVSVITLAKRNDTHGDFILSGQDYCNNVDSDMSSIAIEFYKVIYNIDNMLNKDGSLFNVQYAGDTMNSFRQITNRLSCKQHKKKEWFEKYHCLANFWILPMEVGRKHVNGISKSQVSKAYMDGFLKVLNYKFTEYKDRYPKYFESINDIIDFYKMHGIETIYINNNEPVQITGFNNANDGIDKMIKLIELRADYLSTNYTQELYNLFFKYKLL